ncbi:hypothetical protein P691DRAFT_803557 [Macrolepiota fuliginosa MF-IS2]|uniref:WW domain-containing protein n=1 Tax=Macrolepiota fuliginosa MF-IS2 TaxID=1400762 RepID=A0A9P6C2Q9_9AGAR|nr:hypothetical protein P691DRAFT_803557 [Macrolepiota fuliginosa MF-IS2]
MAQTALKDLRPLPPGWQQHWNQEMSKWYYVQMTCVPPKVTFSHPLDLSPSPNSGPHTPPPPYPQTQSEGQYPNSSPKDQYFKSSPTTTYHVQRAPSISSMSSGFSSPNNPDMSSPRGSVAMSIERVSTSSRGPVTPAQSIVQNYSAKRGGTMPLNQMPQPNTHLHPQPVHANTMPGLPVGQRPRVSPQVAGPPNPMAKMPEPQVTTNPGGVYRLPQTRPIIPQSNPSMLSVASDSTSISETSSLAPLKAQEKKKRKGKDPKKKSWFGSSAMDDLREEHQVAVTSQTTVASHPVGIGAATLPPMMGLPGQATMNAGLGFGGQAQMGVGNTMTPGLVPGQQLQNMGLGVGAPGGMAGMQNFAPTMGQMGMQGTNMMARNQPLPPGVIDLRKVGSSVAKAAGNMLSGALYMTTGISSQDLANFRGRMRIAFSGVPLNDIGIDAKQLEAVLTGQPGANYQGVTNALMIQQQKSQILAMQTGQPAKNVNYQDLIRQVQKMQNLANHKMQQAMVMNAGAQGMDINGMQMQAGMMGTMGTGMVGQQNMMQPNALLQQQIQLEQQRLQQMQASMGQVPMMMGHQQMMPQMGLQMQPMGVVANPMMQSSAVAVQPVATKKGKSGKKLPQVANTTAVGKQGKKVKNEKPLPAAPGGRKKKATQAQPTPPSAPSQVNTATKKPSARVKGATRAGAVNQGGQQGAQQQAVGAGRGGRVQQTGPREGNGRAQQMGPRGGGGSAQQTSPRGGGVERGGRAQQAGPRGGRVQQAGPRGGRAQQAGPRGGKAQQAGPRGGRQRQPGRAAQNQATDQQDDPTGTGGDDEGYDIYIVTAQQDDDEDNDGDEQDDDEDGDEEGDDDDDDDDDEDDDDGNDENGDDNEDDVDVGDDDDDDGDGDDNVDVGDADEDDGDEDDGVDGEDDDEYDVNVDVTLYGTLDPTLDPSMQGQDYDNSQFMVVGDPGQQQGGDYASGGLNYSGDNSGGFDYSGGSAGGFDYSGDNSGGFDYRGGNGGFDYSGDNSGGDSGFDVSASFGDMNLNTYDNS